MSGSIFSTQTTQQKLWEHSNGPRCRNQLTKKKHVPDSLPIALGSPIFESKSCFHGRRPIVESHEFQWRSTSSCFFPYLRETASKNSKYTTPSEINTYKTSFNTVMTFSFSLRVTIWQVVQTAFSFFLVRHLCTKASRPQHLSSAIFCSVRTDWMHDDQGPVEKEGRHGGPLKLLTWPFGRWTIDFSLP